MPPVNSLTKIKSVPLTILLLIGDISRRDSNVNVGLRLAYNPSFFLILNNPSSGLTERVGLLSNLGSPTAPNSTASEFTQISWVVSGYGSPVLSIAAAPTRPSCQVIEWLNFFEIALQILTASLITSGPIPSPGNKDIFKFIFYIILSIFSVALIAETVWSESNPLVTNSFSEFFQVINVSQRASEWLPGGIVTE